VRRAAATYRERGTGEPIVFVHGVFTNGDLWRNVVPALATCSSSSF
jgi:pimeloyl-ACP methyl ester carboxylesterase